MTNLISFHWNTAVKNTASARRCTYFFLVHSNAYSKLSAIMNECNNPASFSLNYNSPLQALFYSLVNRFSWNIGSQVLTGLVGSSPEVSLECEAMMTMRIGELARANNHASLIWPPSLSWRRSKFLLLLEKRGSPLYQSINCSYERIFSHRVVAAVKEET